MGHLLFVRRFEAGAGAGAGDGDGMGWKGSLEV